MRDKKESKFPMFIRDESNIKIEELIYQIIKSEKVSSNRRDPFTGKILRNTNIINNKKITKLQMDNLLN
jgi:hypothetical protein